jgi:hypothetical protein
MIATLIVIFIKKRKLTKRLIIQQIHFQSVEDTASDVAEHNDPVHDFGDDINFIHPVIALDHIEQHLFEVYHVIDANDYCQPTIRGYYVVLHGGSNSDQNPYDEIDNPPGTRYFPSHNGGGYCV